MPTCYYCQKEGHVVYQCPTVPPCAKCGKKGHKAIQCSATKSVTKPVPKVTKPATKPVPKVTKPATKPVPKYVPKPKPTNLFAFFDTNEDTNEVANEVANEVEDQKFSWWREMENDFSFMNIKPNQQMPQ